MFGRVTHIDLKRKFGFVRANGERREFFFHRDDLCDLTFDERLLYERVDFDPRTGDKGPIARRVRTARFEVYR